MEYCERLKKAFKENNIEIIEYNGEKGFIRYKCLDCGTVYQYACARNLFSKITLCKKCYKPFTKWNKERLQERLNKLFPESDLTVLECQSMRGINKVKCNKCGEVEEVKNIEPLLCSRKEYFCMNCEKDKNQIFNHMMKELEAGHIELIKWNGVNNKVKFKCKRCGHIFEKFVTKEFNGKLCPNCFKVHNQFNFEQGQALLNKIGNNEYELLQFKGTNEKSLIRHRKCGFCFSKRIYDLGKGCPKCYRKYSSYEKKVVNFLDEQKINYVFQKRYEDLPFYSFDFLIYLSNKEVLLEVQGEQHYEESCTGFFGDFEYQEKRDFKKKQYCLNNNIPLIEIPYWEIDNLENFLLPKFRDYLERE